MDQYGRTYTFNIDGREATINGATFTASDSGAGTVTFTYSGAWSLGYNPESYRGYVTGLYLIVELKDTVAAEADVVNNDVTEATLEYAPAD